MTTLELKVNLSDRLAREAQAAGLLTPRALERLLSNALARQRAADALLSVADEVAAAGVAPMSMQEITAEVKRVARAVLEGLILKHVAHRFSGSNA